MRLNERFVVLGNNEAGELLKERLHRAFFDGFSQGIAVAGLMLSAERDDLNYEWSVDPNTPLLTVAARAGAWALGQFDEGSEEGRGFIAGFVAQVLAVPIAATASAEDAGPSLRWS
jgi:hypothetical protein